MKIDAEMARFLGLDESEKKILNTLNEERHLLSDISKTTIIPRTSLYYILPRLEKRGFLYTRKVGSKIYWYKSHANEYIEKYNQIVLKQDPTKSKGGTRMIYGVEELTNTLLSTTKIEPRNRLRGIQPEASIKVLLEKASLEKINQFNKIVKDKKIIVEGIVHENYFDKVKLKNDELKNLLTSFSGRSADYAKLPEGFLQDTKAEIYLWENKIAILNWDKEFGMVIENDDVFELLKAMFDSTKYLLEKYDQNEKIAKKLIGLK